MAVECSREAILDFMEERGGRVKNTDLIEHFQAVFPEDPEERATVRKVFKHYVDNIALVRTDSGVKYVCLRKKFRLKEKEPLSTGTEAEPGTGQASNHEKPVHRYPTAPHSRRIHGDDVEQLPGGVLPGSGYGSDGQLRAAHEFSSATVSPDRTEDNPDSRGGVCVVEEADARSGEMGNRASFKRERRESRKERTPDTPDIPEITVIEASPLPAEGSMFTLSGPVQTGPTGATETESLSLGGLKEAEQTTEVIRRRNSKLVPRQEESDGGGDEVDNHSLSGSEGASSPKSSRKHFIEVMMTSSPQVRRSMVLRRSVYLAPRNDSDSASLVSSNLDEDRTAVTLDPLEHEWMMCASDGEWGSLYQLLATDPSLVLRKDFVTGFTCLHWAAKQGKPELIALIINFAKQHDVPISVDVRSNTGYTPLHVAAMHSHMEVVKLLVGAYGADVEVRDYSGRKACQYLTDNASVDIQDIIGAYEHSDSHNTDCKNGGRWRFSKVLQSNLKPLRLLSPNACDSVDGEVRPRDKVLRRRSSLSRMKPKLQKLRLRTSQIVHSTTFRDTEEHEGSGKGSFKSRPKTHFFG